MITEQEILDLGFYDLEAEYCEAYQLGNLIIEFIPDGSVSLRISNNGKTEVVNNPTLEYVKSLLPEL